MISKPTADIITRIMADLSLVPPMLSIGDCPNRFMADIASMIVNATAIIKVITVFLI